VDLDGEDKSSALSHRFSPSLFRPGDRKSRDHRVLAPAVFCRYFEKEEENKTIKNSIDVTFGHKCCDRDNRGLGVDWTLSFSGLNYSLQGGTVCVWGGRGGEGGWETSSRPDSTEYQLMGLLL